MSKVSATYGDITVTAEIDDHMRREWRAMLAVTKGSIPLVTLVRVLDECVVSWDVIDLEPHYELMHRSLGAHLIQSLVTEFVLR